MDKKDTKERTADPCQDKNLLPLPGKDSCSLSFQSFLLNSCLLPLKGCQPSPVGPSGLSGKRAWEEEKRNQNWRRTLVADGGVSQRPWKERSGLPLERDLRWIGGLVPNQTTPKNNKRSQQNCPCGHWLLIDRSALLLQWSASERASCQTQAMENDGRLQGNRWPQDACLPQKLPSLRPQESTDVHQVSWKQVFGRNHAPIPVHPLFHNKQKVQNVTILGHSPSCMTAHVQFSSQGRGLTSSVRCALRGHVICARVV
ncbi:uncharacterized protein LOC128113634 [Peromyscus californicus insignis]|uniref:uncharacterized protein LOC128113634 n=1 Tax=Peromyscus californicus insignis TaxID=564181 RepID=UPI0022A67BD3|nr:uncharacterized protein LOC128113634 [Peromyscus californicus insignis]